ATLRIFAARNVTRTTIVNYRHSLVKTRYAGVRLDHAPQGNLWFALSGNDGDQVVYEHVGFSCDGSYMHGWQMIYPASERTFYDLVADEILRNSMPTVPCDASPPLPHQNPLRRPGL